MDSESQTGMILSQLEAWAAELERTVQGFELAVADVEQRMDALEQLEGGNDEGDESYLQPLTRAFVASQNAAALVYAAGTALGDAIAQAERALQSGAFVDDDAPFPNGTLICEGRYRLVQLLYRRPRVHLYLAQRLTDSPRAEMREQPLVAIRELLLTDLPPTVRWRIERAAFEEFAAPRFFGSPHLPGVGDRVHVENGRHYLVMQPRPIRGNRPAFAVTLSELLPGQGQGPAWLEMPTALNWGIQLCRTVARLHRMKNILGELTPEMVLVDREGGADWAPILLAGWPPAPLFWPADNEQEAQKLYNQMFPSLETDARLAQDTAPAASSEQGWCLAPEVFAGRRNERSDVYVLGAILYLLLTRSAPMAAPQRLRSEQANQAAREQHHATRAPHRASQRRSQATEQAVSLPALTLPHLLNERISPLLEQILLRALALNPEQRFANALDLAEALEGMNLKMDVPAPALPTMPQAKVSRLRRLLEWLKKRPA